MCISERYIDVEKDVRLWIRTYGKSTDPACLFISGAGSNSSFWSKQLCLNLVQQGFFVITYDHRDFGYSSKIDFDVNPFNFNDLVEDSLKILNELKIENFHVIGHSMGGFIAQLLSIENPQRVLSFGSLSASTNSASLPLPPEKTWEIFLQNQPENDFEKDLPDFMEVWKYLNGTASFDEELAIEYTRNLYAHQDILGALGASHVKAQSSLTDRTELLKKVDVPALVIHGEEDFLVPKGGGIHTADCLVNSKLVLIAEMGHMPFNKRILHRFKQEILGFLVSFVKR